MNWGNSHEKTQKAQKILCACVFLWLFLLPAFAQQRPLLTEDPRLIPYGAVVTELGFGYFRRARFPLSGLEGDQYSILANSLNFGLGPRAEFQIGGVAQHLVHVREGGTGWRNDWGDAVLATKIKIVDETPVLPIVSFRPAVVLPNGNDARGISLNSTQFLGSLLVGKTIGRAFVFGNAGLGILTDTVRLRAQEDVFIYGLAAMLPISSRLSLLGEWNGRQNPESGPSPGLESRGEVRLGLQVMAGGLRWDVGGMAGLTRLDPRGGLVFGVTKEFQLWK
jgi:hypothetical protein